MGIEVRFPDSAISLMLFFSQREKFSTRIGGDAIIRIQIGKELDNYELMFLCNDSLLEKVREYFNIISELVGFGSLQPVQRAQRMTPTLVFNKGIFCPVRIRWLCIVMLWFLSMSFAVYISY